MRQYSRNRKDSNHQDIIKVFKALGFSVLDISNLTDCCDLMVAKNGHTVAVELKDGSKIPSKRKLTPGEQAFAQSWITGGHWALIESIQDVEELHRKILKQRTIVL